MNYFRAKLKQKTVLAALVAAIVSTFTQGVPAAEEPEYLSEYIGQERRSIKSLSDDDIRELTTGAGWGLAKAAELNGLPGPKHVLEMKDKISLTAEQEREMKALFEEMNEKAIVLGRQLIGQEKELNDRFAQRDIDESILEELLARISATYTSLRYTHLSAHLRTPDILSDEQIRKYNELRGYSSNDPCAHIPEGHDPVMWRKHNNCD
jgi:Spy/CpxP family protein refolding chaperone